MTPSLRAVVVNTPANPLRIARALADEPGFAFWWPALRDAPAIVACRPSSWSSELDPEPSLQLDAGAGPLASVPRWVGVLPYECRRELERRSHVPDEPREAPHQTRPSWARYGAVVRIHRDVRVVGDDPAAVERLVSLVRCAVPRVGSVGAERLASEPDAAHRKRIETALELIAEGQIYQVNLARRFDFRVDGRAVDLVERFVRSARAPYAFAFDAVGLTVAGSSPELLLDVDPRGRLETSPIKGTRPRGGDAREDARLARELDEDPKERAELSMVVDVERNDFGRIATTGSVRVLGTPRVQAFGTVHHRIATVVARLRPTVSRSALLSSVLPSGSVTGAPKVRAMEVIARLEAARRGLYTGGYGYLAHDGSMRLAMAIRTLTRRDGVAHYFAGGGIVFDSDPGREVIETGWKAVQVERLFGSQGSPQ